MEGRGYTDFYRNTSEEMFIKTIMDSSIAMPAPTMEMLGFKNLSQSFRADSEELFKNWLTNTENNGGIPHRTRQASRRITTEPSNLSNQQHGAALQKKKTEELFPQQRCSMAGESSTEPNQHVAKNPVENGLQATNLFLAKAWFNRTQPMTRSRSSELRRRYAALQNTPTSIGIEAMNNMYSNDASHFKQEYADTNGFNNHQMCEVSNHLPTFMSPSTSSTSTFNTPQAGKADNISSVVNMLKGTLERKKLCNNVEKEAVEDSSFVYHGSEEALGNTGWNQVQGNQFYDMTGSFQPASHVKEAGVLHRTAGSYGTGLDGIAVTANQYQMSTISREPSQSESSAPVVSNGFDTCDGPSISGQAVSVCESSRKQMGNKRSAESSPRTKVEQGDPTKKRRVERSRKMAEAKERNLTPTMTSDMQSLLKRCENLEKEVRSLKLNLSFMNRKDSEQTKQIEDLQKQNEDLSKEKGRLLEEIERIVSETCRM